jgi:hypothetical protein
MIDSGCTWHGTLGNVLRNRIVSNSCHTAKGAKTITATVTGSFAFYLGTFVSAATNSIDPKISRTAQ